MNIKLLVEIAGWIAAALILAAYALVTSGRVKPRSVPYQLLNVLGAAGFIVNSGYNHAIPSAALNIIWMGIGLVALTRLSKSGNTSATATGHAHIDEGAQKEIPKIGSTDAPGG